MTKKGDEGAKPATPLPVFNLLARDPKTAPKGTVLSLLREVQKENKKGDNQARS
jgi:hypothetical protein